MRERIALGQRTGVPGHQGVVSYPCPTVLELIDLRRRFGDVVALDGVSFQVPEGRIVGFVGRNGAGKTTAMRIALGVLQADDGEVRWRGAPVDTATRRRFGYMPEERGLYPKMRVLEQLVYLARLRGTPKAIARDRAEELLATLDVVGDPGARVESLSLGNQQRVQLAAALIHEPELLVLDEPFSGLDPVGVDVLSGVLRREASEEGVAVVFSSHQLDLVERLCDEVVLIDRGRVAARGTIEELRASRARNLWRVEVGGADDAWWQVVPGVVPVETDDGIAVLELPAGVDPQRVLDVARAAGDVLGFGPVRPSLGELFREVVA
jgi:ABC-2 type transport system ATP-binding protein